MNDIYTSPFLAIVNISGFFLESSLLIYLLYRFFPVTHNKPVNLKERLAVAGSITTIILTVDLLIRNTPFSHACYVLLLYLLPLLYACLRLKGSLLLKMLLCSLFILMNTLLESMFLVLQYCNLSAGVILVFRRIFCKLLLYFIIRFLLLNAPPSPIKISKAYWSALAVVCGSEYLFLRPQIMASNYSLSYKLILISTCLFIPLSFYYMVSQLRATMEDNQILTLKNHQLELSQQYVTQVNEISESLRHFRHDYKSHLFCIDALLSEGKYNQLHEYLMKLHQRCLSQSTITEYALNSAVNVILNQKAQFAKRNGIAFKANIICPEYSRIQDMDLVALISNLLDNALEAAITTPEPRVFIDIQREKAYLRIEVVNTTSGDILQDNPTMDTTKVDCEVHGLGLKIVRSIVDSYEGMYQVFSDSCTLRSVVLLLDVE